MSPTSSIPSVTSVTSKRSQTSRMAVFHESPKSNASTSMRQRLFRCIFLSLFYAFCHIATRLMQESSCSLRKLSGLTHSPSTTNSIGGPLLHPRSAKEFFLGSFASSSSKLSTVNYINNILSKDDPERPIFVLYVGVPEEPSYLQCAMCTMPEITRSLKLDTFVYLGTCPYECDQLLDSQDSTTSNGTTTLLNEGNYYTRSNPKTYFTSSAVTEPRADNTTLGIVPHSLEMSQAHGRRRNIPQLEVEFMLALDQVRLAGLNALLVHPGASLWGAKHIRSLSAFLKLHHWQVHVLVGPYRPLDEYHAEISYAYVQHNFLNSYGIRLWPDMQAGGDRYVGWAALHDSILNDLEDLVQESQGFDGHPVEIVRSNYARHFANTHYIVVPQSTSSPSSSVGNNSSSLSLSDDDIIVRRPVQTMQHLFCQMLGLPNACAVATHLSKLPTPPLTTPTETWKTLQLDAMAVEARELGWIPKALANRGSRLTVRRHLEEYVVKRNLSLVQHLPLTCWSESTMADVHNLTMHFERRILRSDPIISKAALLNQAVEPRIPADVRNRYLYCHVNVDKAFRDSRWKEFFQSLPVHPRRPEDDDEENAGADDDTDDGNESEEHEVDKLNKSGNDDPEIETKAE